MGDTSWCFKNWFKVGCVTVKFWEVRTSDLAEYGECFAPHHWKNPEFFILFNFLTKNVIILTLSLRPVGIEPPQKKMKLTSNQSLVSEL